MQNNTDLGEWRQAGDTEEEVLWKTSGSTPLEICICDFSCHPSLDICLFMLQLHVFLYGYVWVMLSQSQ